MLNITKINALAELQRLGWDVTPSGPNEVKCICPVHEDQVPSLSLNVEKNVWICHASQCKAHGDIIALLAYIMKVERKTIIVDLSERYPDLKIKKVVKQDRIEKWHSAIWESGPLLQELYNRGVTDAEIREQRIGYSLREQRIMIPIFDLDKQVINVRKYLPGAAGPDKMKNMGGYDSRALYLPEQLKYPTIWILGGELKALVAKRFLNPSNIGVTSFTGAEGAWDEALTPLFENKIVFICMDIDAGGREGARRIAPYLNTKAQSVYIISLPLDKQKYPKGDVNDWVAKEKAGKADFATAMRSATKYIPPYYREQDDESIKPESCDLFEVRKSTNIGKKCECSFVINMLDPDNYCAAKSISVSCTRDQSLCPACIVNSKKVNEATGKVNVILKPTNQEFLGLIGINQIGKGMHYALLNALGILDCKSAMIEINSYYDVFDARLGTILELESNRAKVDINQPAYIMGLIEEELELNVPYIGICRNFPDPRLGKSTLLVSEIRRQEDSLSSFSLSETDVKLLSPFRIII